MTNYNTKIVELQADVQTIWKLQCQNLYNSKNLGALAIRESIQNSVDAINRAVKNKALTQSEGLIQISYNDESTVTITDNGCGMDVQTIHDKFLNLGGTTKGDTDNVGGFGIAKAVILGCGDWFSINTQDNYLTSDDLGKKPITKTKEFRQGTQIILRNVQIGKNLYVKDDLEGFRAAIWDYVRTSDIPYRVELNGETLEPRFIRTKKTYRIPATFNVSSDMIPDDTKLRIDVYKDEQSYSKYLYVRLRGLTQFKQYLGWNANCNVVVDFDTKLDPRSTEYPFSTNREGLKTQYQGILEAIKDKITQSPMSISSDDYFKETMYENTKENVEEERKISALINDSKMVSLVAELNKAVEGIQAQGEYKQPTVTDRIKQYQEQVKELASNEGKTVEQYVKTMESNDLKKLDNPLEYSWLIWEDKGYTGKRLNKSKSVEIILLWDGILRIMAKNYMGLDGMVFYPGLIVKDDTLGMCVEKTVGKGERRSYVMVNPFLIPTGDDTQIALYLMGVAAHELAHVTCGCYEAHGETFSYTREAIMNANLLQLNTVTQIVKQSKLKRLVSRLTKSTDSSFKNMTYEEVVQAAEECGIDTEEYTQKYMDQKIVRMRLIMAIKSNS